MLFIKMNCLLYIHRSMKYLAGSCKWDQGARCTSAKLPWGQHTTTLGQQVEAWVDRMWAGGAHSVDIRDLYN